MIVVKNFLADNEALMDSQSQKMSCKIIKVLA